MVTCIKQVNKIMVNIIYNKNIHISRKLQNFLKLKLILETYTFMKTYFLHLHKLCCY